MVSRASRVEDIPKLKCLNTSCCGENENLRADKENDCEAGPT